MADHTDIEWTDATWNPITGCSVVSPGCTNCYAMRLAGTRLKHTPSRVGLTQDTKAGPVWNGEVRLNEKWLEQPLRWRRPRRIFVCAHGDLFHESVPDEWIDRVFAVMALAQEHTFQVLTKRAERMRDYCLALMGGQRRVADAARDLRGSVLSGLAALSAGFGATLAQPAMQHMPRNVWLGVSVEDQRSADERLTFLKQIPAAVRWVSAEPLLGCVDLTPWIANPVKLTSPRNPPQSQYMERGCVDWVVAGGESGPSARPMHPEWARALRDQCVAWGVPFFFKQWGAWSTVYDRDVDDPDWRCCSAIQQGNEKGRWLNLAGGHGFHGERVVYVDPVGKKSAGRELDGRTWDEFPRGDAA